MSNRWDMICNGRTDWLTNGQPEGAILICLTKFLRGHKKKHIYSNKSESVISHQIRTELRSNVTNVSIRSMATDCTHTRWTLLTILLMVNVRLTKQENLTVCASFFVGCVDSVSHVCAQMVAIIQVKTFVTSDFDHSLISILTIKPNLNWIKLIFRQELLDDWQMIKS